MKNLRSTLMKGTSKYWAYGAASFLCLVVIALMAGACGAEWYRDKTSGQIYDMTTRRRGAFFAYEISYYMFHLEYSQQIQDAEGTQVSILPTASCDYTSDSCLFVNIPFNTKEFKGMYAAIFTFSLCTIAMAVVLGFLLLFMNLRAEAMPGMGSKILTVLAIVFALMMLVFVLITWAIIWRHPKSTREAVGLPDSYCDQWSISDRYQGGPYCLWQYEWDWGDSNIKNLTFHRDVYATGVKQEWGPTTGWILTTISFGFTAWIILLTLGWRPAFFKG